MFHRVTLLIFLSFSLLSLTSCSETGSLTALSLPQSPSMPTAATMSLFNINAGDSYTRSTSVTLTFEALNASEIYLTTDSSCSSGGSWISYSSTLPNYSLSSTDQEKLIYAKVRNLKGEESLCISDSIILDTTPPSEPASLSLQNPVSSPGIITTPVITVGNNLEVGALVKIFSDNACSLEIGSVSATATAMNIISSALSAGDYDIYSQQIDRAGNVSNCSTATVHYLLDLNAPVAPVTTPPAPSSLSLLVPLVSPNSNSSPTIRTSGVAEGNTVKIYLNDNTCNVVNQVASGVVVALQSSIDLQTSVLTEGSHVFYANTTNSAGNSSTCSTASVSYQLDLTPPTVPTGLSLGNSIAMTSETPLINWNPSTDASGIARYEIQIFDSSNQTIGVPTKKISGEKKTGLNLTDTAQYYVKVRAIDSAGNVSAYSSATPLWTAYIGSDTCDGSPTIGTLCSDGTYYVGNITIGDSTYKLATTPGGCSYEAGGDTTTSPSSYFTPSCNGTNDSMRKIAKTLPIIVGSDQVKTSTSDPSTISGFASTNAVLAIDPNTPAFAYCKYLNYGGSTDWFLPNRSELHMMACHGTTSTNNLMGTSDDVDCLSNGYGSNLNIVPNFISGENIMLGYTTYHTSSTSQWDGGTNLFEQTVNGAYSGSQTFVGANATGLVRCVRVIP